jgi:hypothetical protein
MPLRFQKVFDAISAVLSNPPIGDTGYLDMMPWMPPSKGTDESGRPFFTLPLHVHGAYRIGKNPVHIDSPSVGQTTFFKRYSGSDSDIWVTAESHVAGFHANPCLHGELVDPDNGNLEEMLLRVVNGEEVEFLWKAGWNDGTFYRRICRLATPEEIAASVKSDTEAA